MTKKLKKVVAVVLILSLIQAITVVSGLNAFAVTNDSECSVSDNIIVKSGTCGDNLTWTLSDSNLFTISGTGNMYDYDLSESNYNPPEWYDFRDEIENIRVETGVESIGAYAFYDCENLLSINTGKTITTIGEYAFANCTSLADIDYVLYYISERKSEIYARYIKTKAFYNCSALKSIRFESEYAELSDRAFENCTSLEEIYIPRTLDKLGEAVFIGCENLKYVGIPRGCTWKYITYYNRAIYDGYGNLYLSLPAADITVFNSGYSSGWYVKSYALANCNKLKTITFNNGLEYIYHHAIYNCNSVEKIEFGTKMLKIYENSLYFANDYEFSGENRTISITIPNKTTEIDDNAIYNGYAYDKVNKCFKQPEIIIYGYKGSTAEKFVERNGERCNMRFVDIDQEATTQAVTTATTESTNIIVGDVNADHKIGVDDATEIQKHLTMLSTLSSDALSVADTDRSCSVNIKDATNIQIYLIGLPNHGYVGENYITPCPTTTPATTQAVTPTTTAPVTIVTTAPTTNPPTTAPVTENAYYYYNSSNWSTVKAYYWSDNNKSMITWPGVQMEYVSDNTYKIVLPKDAQYIIFTNGSAQTEDITLASAGMIYKNGSWAKYESTTPTTAPTTTPQNKNMVYYDNSRTNWQDVYAYYWSDSNTQMISWPGIKMNKVDNTKYSIELPKDTQYIIFSNNGSSQTSDIKITEFNKTYSNGIWF